MPSNEFLNISLSYFLLLITDVRESGDVSMEDVVVPMATIALASSDEISNCQFIYSLMLMMISFAR